MATPPRTITFASRQAIVVVPFCAVAVIVGALSVYAGAAPLAPAGVATTTLDGIRCPAASAYVDPIRLRRAIEERMARIFEEAAPQTREAALAATQLLLCRSVLQGPADGRDWAWLMFTAPEAMTDPDVRSSFYDRSFALAPLEVEPVYWRVVFGADHWSGLDETERKVFLADAETLARMPFGYRYISVLAQLGAHEGPELTAIFRDLVARYSAGGMEKLFDDYVKKAKPQR